MWTKHIKRGVDHPWTGDPIFQGANEDGSPDETQGTEDNQRIRYVTGKWDNTLPFPFAVPVFTDDAAVKNVARRAYIDSFPVLQPIIKCGTLAKAVKVFYMLRGIKIDVTFTSTTRKQGGPITYVNERISAALSIGWRGERYMDVGNDPTLQTEPEQKWSEKAFASKLAPRMPRKVKQFNQYKIYTDPAYTHYTSGNIPLIGGPDHVNTLGHISVAGIIKTQNGDKPAYYILGSPYIVGDGRAYPDRYGYIISLGWLDLSGWPGSINTVHEEVRIEDDVSVFVGSNMVRDEYYDPSASATYKQFTAPVVKFDYFMPEETTFP